MDNNQPDVKRPEQVFLLMQADGTRTGGSGDIDYLELWSIIWRDKWIAIAITAAFAIAMIVFSLLATEWYRAQVVMVPAKQRQQGGINLDSSMGGLAGLVGLAGVAFGEHSPTAEPLAVLRSRDLARSFIEEENLLPTLFADKWDPKEGKWKGADPKKWPDIRDGIKYFQDAVCQITEDKKNNLISVSIEWTDRDLAANWANLLVARANDRVRERALSEAQANVNYLREELANSNVVALQQPIGRILENEMQTLMVARGNKEYAFRVIDRATPPKYRSFPKRTLFTALATVAGGMVSLFVIFVRHRIRSRATK